MEFKLLMQCYRDESSKLVLWELDANASFSANVPQFVPSDTRKSAGMDLNCSRLFKALYFL